MVRWPHGKTFFLVAKLSFSWQNFLSRGKTFFLTAKLSFSRQNLLSYGKTLYRKGMHLRIKPKESANVSKMAGRGDNIDDLVREYFSRDSRTRKYVCFFNEITGALLASGH